MTTRRAWAAVLVLITISFASAILSYPHLPAKMASHWNAQGQVDGYMSKTWGLLLVPSMLVGLALLFAAIPKVDPLKGNIQQFRKYYDLLLVLFTLYLSAIHLWMILWNMGTKISSNIVMPFAVGVLFFYIGVLLEKAKRNWFVGIRTPWTLSSEAVWDRTHRRGGRLFKLAAVFSFVGAFFGRYAVFFILVPTLAVAAYLIIYSYFEYQKETR